MLIFMRWIKSFYG